MKKILSPRLVCFILFHSIPFLLCLVLFCLTLLFLVRAYTTLHHIHIFCMFRLASFWYLTHCTFSYSFFCFETFLNSLCSTSISMSVHHCLVYCLLLTSCKGSGWAKRIDLSQLILSQLSDLNAACSYRITRPTSWFALLYLAFVTVSHTVSIQPISGREEKRRIMRWFIRSLIAYLILFRLQIVKIFDTCTVWCGTW